jgi:hypothetical protein
MVHLETGRLSEDGGFRMGTISSMRLELVAAEAVMSLRVRSLDLDRGAAGGRG